MPERGISYEALSYTAMQRQGLLTRTPWRAGQIVKSCMGINAQARPQAHYALMARVSDYAPSSLVHAAEKRAVVRASFSRGTLHLVTTDDYLAWRGLLSPILDAAMRTEYPRIVAGIDVEKLWHLVRKALAERPLCPERLGRELARRHYPGLDTNALGFLRG